MVQFSLGALQLKVLECNCDCSVFFAICPINSSDKGYFDKFYVSVLMGKYIGNVIRI